MVAESCRRSWRLTALVALALVAAVPAPDDMRARIVVHGRTSTAIDIPVVKVGQEIPRTYAGAQIAATAGFDFFVSEHFALKSSMGDDFSRLVLEVSELAHPHWVSLVGAEPPDPTTRMYLVYAKDVEELRRAMVADIGMGPAGGFGGGFTAFTNRSAYNYPSGTLEYHKRALVIHENLHMLNLLCNGTSGTEGPTYAGEQHVYDPATKRLTVFCFDKACVNNYTDDGLAALRECFVPMHQAVRTLWQGGGGPGTVYQQFFLTDPDRHLKWRLWRDEFAAGRVTTETNAAVMESIHGPLERLDEEWARWVRSRRATFHWVDWGWEQDGDTLRGYGFPHDRNFWSQTDIRLPPGERPDDDPLRMDYPVTARPSSLVGPVARGGEEPVIGYVVTDVGGPAWGGFGLGVEGRRMCRVVIAHDRELVVDGSSLGMPSRVFPLNEELRTAAAADGGRHGVTMRIGREALVVTVRAGGAGNVVEMSGAVPLNAVQRTGLLERPLAVIGKDGIPRITPWIDDGRPPPPDLVRPAPANRWRFAGLDRLETLYRAAWRLGSAAPPSLSRLKDAMLGAVKAGPELQAAAVEDYEKSVEAVADDVARCTADATSRDRALADLAGVFIQTETVRPGEQPGHAIIAGRLTGRLEERVDASITLLDAAGDRLPHEEIRRTLEPRRPWEFRCPIVVPRSVPSSDVTLVIRLSWRGRQATVRFTQSTGQAASTAAP